MRKWRQYKHGRKRAELVAIRHAGEARVAEEARLAAEQPPDITYGCPEPSAVLPGLFPGTIGSQTCAVCGRYRLLVYFDYDPKAGAPFTTCGACFRRMR